MFDCHYDLLTNIIMRKDELEYLKKYCTRVYNRHNITGSIFNLFYMSEKEMKEELGIEKENINVIENFKFVKNYIKNNNLISSDIKYLFGIEGLDYLENIKDLEVLYSLGLRSTNPVWNNKNKFGSGINTNSGLTPLGEELIEKLVELNIAIDLSHSNKKTFWDIINKCRKLKYNGEKPIVFASHSNSKSICNAKRNLDDDQILAIKELDGVIGVVSIKRFCVKCKNYINTDIDFEQKYIDNINYLKKLLNGIENISVSTDDMKYYRINPEYYQNSNVYSQFNVKEKIKNGLLKNNYKNDEIEKILEKNFIEKIYSKLEKI